MSVIKALKSHCSQKTSTYHHLKHWSKNQEIRPESLVLALSAWYDFEQTTLGDTRVFQT